MTTAPAGFTFESNGPLGPNLEIPGSGVPMNGFDLEVMRRFGYSRGAWTSWRRGAGDLGLGGTWAYTFVFEIADIDGYITAAGHDATGRRFVLDDVGVAGHAVHQGIPGHREWWNVQGRIVEPGRLIGIGIEGTDTVEDGIAILRGIAATHAGGATVGS